MLRRPYCCRTRAIAGVDFDIGGSVALTEATPDGVYTGDFNVTADYQ